MFIRNCEMCGVSFKTDWHRSLYCSPECKSKAEQIRKKESYIRCKRKKKPNQELVNIVVEARKQGLSYRDIQIQETLEMIKRK